MAKNPAFLFYSTDYYEGTRTMLPTERAAYIDLMIYQHQHGLIDIPAKRLTLYCAGVSEDDIQHVLDAKFVKVDGGYINEKLKTVLDERKDYVAKQSMNGVVGQFWKKAKSLLNKKEYQQLRDNLHELTNEGLVTMLREYESKPYSDPKAMLIAMLEASLKHLEDEDEIEDEIENTNEIEFSIFWDNFHSITGKPKTDKEAALGYWNKLKRDEKQKAVDKISDYYKSLSDSKYCKKARTYLDDKNFNDEFISQPQHQTIAI